MKKYFYIIAAAALLLTGCRENSNAAAGYEYSENTESYQYVSEADDTISAEISDSMPAETIEKPQKDQSISVPFGKILSENKIEITSDLTNVENIKVYSYEVSTENDDIVTQELVFDGSPEEISENIITVDKNSLESKSYSKDNSAVATSYYADGFRMCFSNEATEVWSDLIGREIRLYTGVCSQYDCGLMPDTACGAANGALILQTAVPVWDWEFTERMNAVRELSGSGEFMSAEETADSVNRYLEENNLDKYQITDFGVSSRETSDIITSSLRTGRPVAVVVMYNYGELNSSEGDPHWITINGFRTDNDGTISLRWADTFTSSENWTDFQVIEDSMNMSGQRNIIALSNAVEDSFV